MSATVVLAHAGHWLTSLAFALAPLTVVAGLAAAAIRERRAARR
jgi:hypothetical protein